MSQVRLCDRCQASAELTTFDITKIGVVIPQAYPSTRQVDNDFEVSNIGFTVSPQDLCETCAASAVWAFALSKLGVEKLRQLSAVLSA